MLNNIRLTFFGESHSKHIGVTMEGIPSGIKIDFDQINEDLQRRRPKKNSGNTNRIEQDNYEIISGYFNNHTTGAPLTILVENNNTHSTDYERGIIRPSHADYPAFVKYNAFNDYRGGGTFSGRLTVLYVIAGSIAKSILKQKNIYVGTRITHVLDTEDESVFHISKENLELLSKESFPSLNEEFKNKCLHLIEETKEQKDSLGGSLTTYAINLPVGLGDVFLNSCESRISYMLFSIPSLKAVSFGEGENFKYLYGSEANDPLEIVNNHVEVVTNNSGGINGGLTNGAPLIVNTTFKAISSIGISQKSVNLDTMENIDLTVGGRHDSFILDRVSVVVDNMIALVLLDLLIDSNKMEFLR